VSLISFSMFRWL